ncbi:MAG: hypothetical protein EBU61_05330, partial [Crocinitomicaceae bacterium]|nr:hypothetical protein [Crocinitomicaceae bacterium]
WYSSLGTIAVGSVSSRKSEIFYWITILFSQTLGTALGDWVADSLGLGYLGAALVFGSLLALIGLGYSLTTLSRTWLFWGAFILTRPLGAVIGDFLDKPLEAHLHQAFTLKNKLPLGKKLHKLFTKKEE